MYNANPPSAAPKLRIAELKYMLRLSFFSSTSLTLCVALSTTKAGIALMRYMRRDRRAQPGLRVAIAVGQLLQRVVRAVTGVLQHGSHTDGRTSSQPERRLVALGILAAAESKLDVVDLFDRRVPGQNSLQAPIGTDSHAQPRIPQRALKMDAVDDPVEADIGRIGREHAVDDASVGRRTKRGS